MADFRVLRRHTTYRLTTWCKMHNPLYPETRVDSVLEKLKILPSEVETRKLLVKIGKNLRKVETTKLVKANISVQIGGEVTKQSLANVFRILGHRIFPKDMMPPKTFKQFIQNFYILFTSGKESPIWASHFLHRIDLNSISFLREFSENERADMFKHFSAWLAENIFWPFLKAHFHMSDTSKRRKELTFYRKSDFQSVIDREFRKFAVDGRLKTLTPEQVERIVAGSDKAPALARCRLLPKKNLTSTRLLARKETTSDKVEIERDQRLLLRFIAKKLYSNMIDVKGITFHGLLSEFQRNRDAGKPIYVVVADIRDAFGSVILSKLSKILREMAAEFKERVLYSHEIKYSMGTGKPTTKWVLSSSEDPKSVADQYPKQCSRLRHSTKARRIDVPLSLKQVSKRCKLHTLQLRVGTKRRHFLMTGGIVQGDTLSSPLCDIYYGHLVRHKMAKFTGKAPGQKLFARGMDDFIFISVDKHEAEEFLRTMQTGFPEYGCQIQPEKTVSNLSNPGKGKEFSFCGSLLSFETLACRPDFSGYFNLNLAYAFKFTNVSSDPWKFITDRILFTSCLNFKPSFLDFAINKSCGPLHVLGNVYEINYFTALRLHAMLTSLYFFYGKQLPSKTCVKMLCQRVENKVLHFYERACKRYDLEQQLDGNKVRALFRLAIQDVLFRRFSSFYKDQDKFSLSKKKLIADNLGIAEIEYLKTVIKTRSTHLVKSIAYQKL